MTAPAPGVVAVVTGANSGVGHAATRRLVERGHTVVMLCRSGERGERARDALRDEVDDAKVELVIGDLSDFATVRTAADRILERHPRLDVLIDNAGLYLDDRRTTDDGWETTMAVNHLGHYLLTRLLLPALRDDGGRVVVVTSEVHRRGQLAERPLPEIFRGEDGYSGLQAYCDSKLANVLFAFELARRERRNRTGVTSNALHPGTLATRIWSRNRNLLSLIMRLARPLLGDAREGGEAVVRLAVDPELSSVTGCYFDQTEEVRASERAYDGELARRLWTESARATGLD